MTDFDAFSPDPVSGDDFAAGGDDPFAADSGAGQEEDPFGLGSAEPLEQDDPFAAEAGSFPEEAATEVDYGELDPSPEMGMEMEMEQTSDAMDDMSFREEAKQEVSILPESAVLGEWQSARNQLLTTRRNAAYEKKEVQQQTAKDELAQFNVDRKAKIDKIKSQNREEETNFKTEMDNLMQFGSQWEKVHKLVNLQPKPNEKPGSSRVDRMRNLLIKLKHDGTK